jgi:hypothetical protein
MLVLAVDLLHVGAKLGDIHPAIPVEGDVDGFTDAIALTQDELKAITLGQLNGSELLLRGERLDCRLRGEVRDVGRLVGRDRKSAGR